jgi:hypothetical protein
MSPQDDIWSQDVPKRRKKSNFLTIQKPYRKLACISANSPRAMSSRKLRLIEQSTQITS